MNFSKKEEKNNVSASSLAMTRRRVLLKKFLSPCLENRASKKSLFKVLNRLLPVHKHKQRCDNNSTKLWMHTFLRLLPHVHLPSCQKQLLFLLDPRLLRALLPTSLRAHQRLQSPLPLRRRAFQTTMRTCRTLHTFSADSQVYPMLHPLPPKQLDFHLHALLPPRDPSRLHQRARRQLPW